MAADDTAPQDSTHGQHADAAEAVLETRRQRAVDLFSAHRYRALQESVFEKRFGAKPGKAAPPTTAELLATAQDDAIDPLITSQAPAAVAARAEAPIGVTHHAVSALDPVLQSQQLPVVTAPVPVATPPSGEAGAPSHEWHHDETQVLAAIPGEPQAEPREWAPGQEHQAVGVPGEAAGDQVWQGEEPAKAPKQGRNFKVATIAGIAMLVIVVVAAWVHEVAFAVLLGAVAIGAIIEWKRALEPHGRRVPLVPLVAATIGMGIATMAAKPEGLMVALMVGCAGVVAWRIGDERMDNTLADSLAGVLTLLWIPFLASFLLLLEIAQDGWQRVLIVVLAVVANDTGALIAGMRFGKHKLLERVSPAKTWEGAIGGVLLGMIVAAIAAHLFFGEWYVGASVGAACAVAAVVGDLAESALKRDIRVKDMSSILPGHGGILDRVDSLLFAAPVGYVVFAIFLGTLGGGGL